MLLLIPLLPFAGFVVNALVGRRLSKPAAAWVACGAMVGAVAAGGAAVWRLLALPPGSRVIDEVAFTWIEAGDLVLPLAFRLDPLGALMVAVVAGVGFLIHVYSVAYMHEERPSEYARYFWYLNLFASFMLILVLAANVPVMFVGWEGVGLCSYLLIGFWYHRPAAADAGKKAFIVNRIGDFGFLLGMLLLFATFGTFDFRELAARIGPLDPELTFGTLSLAALLLFVGATGKSAQIPLYVWLPDAMEGPTPVSALIHAATMVTAGVYMIGRTAVLFSHAPDVLQIVAAVGLATAMLAGTIGLVQHDIKRVLAYSTVSQLGFMFLAMGVGAYAAGIFHLYTHAFFKALLFLGSGAVIHALAGEQDLRRMGGLRRALPLTYWTFLIGALAIAGVPGLSGFFSKDEILYRVYSSGHPVMWGLASATALLTAVYMFRLVFLAFHGPARQAARHPAGDHAADPGVHGAPGHGQGGLHDAPRPMAVALVALAVGAIAAGYAGVPAALGGVNRLEHFLAPSFEAPAQTPLGESNHGALPVSPAYLGETAAEQEAHTGLATERALMGVSSAAALAGIAIAAWFFLRRREAAAAVAASLAPVHRLLLNKYFVDEIYGALIVRPIRVISERVLWRGVDATLVDGAVNGTGRLIEEGGSLLRRLQAGTIRSYAASIVVGVILVIGYYLWR